MRVALLVGGWMDEERRAATARGERPEADIFLLEERLGCRALDFSWLEQKCSREPLTRLLRKAIGWSAALAVRALPELLQADAIYCSGEDVGVPLGWLLALSGRQNIVMRLEQPLYGSSPLKRALWLALFKGALRRVSSVLCRTEAHVRHLRALGYARAHFTPETTDTSFWNPSSAAEEGRKARYEPHGEMPHGEMPEILSAGLEERDYATLIQAMRGTDWRLTIAAGSPWSKFSFASDSPPEGVTVCKLSQSELREKYARAAVVVLCVNPTERACGMNVVLEAWAMGVPVVATGTEGLESYLKDGENAWLVPPRDPDALQNALKKLLASPEEMRRLADNSKRCIESWGSLESYVSEVESALLARSSASCAKSAA